MEILKTLKHASCRVEAIAEKQAAGSCMSYYDEKILLIS